VRHQQSLFTHIQSVPAAASATKPAAANVPKRPRTGQERMERNKKKTKKVQDLSPFFKVK
jgi:hypothetical protein